MDMRSHIIGVAGGLFYAEGIRAVGVDRVIAEAGIAKATLYRHFSTKETLIIAYLQERHERLVQQLTAQVLEREIPDALQKALLPFRLLHESGARTDYRGCAFLIAVAENEGCAPILALAREHKRWIRGMFETLVQPLTEDGAALAEELALCYDGALAALPISRGTDAALVAQRCAAMLIQARVVQPVSTTV